ncbi:MAG: TorF family putative porin [Puniceicoccaceae bacterium]
MKKTIAILAAAVAGTSLVNAQELSISTTVAWESDYVFRGVQLAEEYFAPSIDISYGDFYAGIWAALPVDAMYGNEVDFYAGYGVGLSETVSADFGFTYYTYPDAGDEFFDSVNTFEIYGGLSFEAPLSPSVYVFYDFDLEALTIEASGGHSVEISEEGTVDFSAYLGYVDADGFDWYYYGLGVALTHSFTDNASASVGVNWYGSEEDTMFGGDDNEIAYGVSFSAGF